MFPLPWILKLFESAMIYHLSLKMKKTKCGFFLVRNKSREDWLIHAEVMYDMSYLN